jgi:Ni/Fe-hydrogenase subunit HybB-like protein
MYPNEFELQWSVLIVLYPYITGLVAGAFILASLERVFRVDAVRPTYRLALLTALAFLLVAPLPLQLHLGHPERSFEMYLTPHTSSAMAMFGFVYLWYLTVVLLLEIWLEWRVEIVEMAQSSQGIKPGGAPHRRESGLRRHRDRHPVGLSAARLRRFHFRFGES